MLERLLPTRLQLQVGYLKGVEGAQAHEAVELERKEWKSGFLVDVRVGGLAPVLLLYSHRSWILQEGNEGRWRKERTNAPTEIWRISGGKFRQHFKCLSEGKTASHRGELIVLA